MTVRNDQEQKQNTAVFCNYSSSLVRFLNNWFDQSSWKKMTDQHKKSGPNSHFLKSDNLHKSLFSMPTLS